jgi:hypothetical protein
MILSLVYHNSVTEQNLLLDNYENENEDNEDNEDNEIENNECYDYLMEFANRITLMAMICCMIIIIIFVSFSYFLELYNPLFIR